MGTRINHLKLTEVVDGDTIKVEGIGGSDGIESLRLLCVDTEESAIGSKPVTEAGKEASRLAKEYFGCNEEGFPNNDDPVYVDIEFDTVEPVSVCLEKHRGEYGRLLCYVHTEDGENYNLKTVRDGWSPYFVKYGRSRLYHEDFLAAETEAQSAGLMVWDPSVNLGGNCREYSTLIPWWNLRDGIISCYRSKGLQAGVLAVRSNYDDIMTAANNGDVITVLCDLQHGISALPGNGALIETGSSTRSFDLWIPDRADSNAQSVLRLIEIRYAGEGKRGYVYASGQASLYNGKPEIILTEVSQLSDIPPGC